MIGGSAREADGWFDWAYRGVNFSLPGNGGLECRDFLSISQRWLESVVASVGAIYAMIHAFPHLKLPRTCPCVYQRRSEPLGKRILLFLMCLTFGIELGFKFATRQMIWIGNPCHLVTMIQIFLLAAPPSRIVTAAFRLHMHMLTGAPIAILFPVINTRLLPFETAVYFIQHILMLVIPFYLMHTGDPFVPEALGDFSWAMMSFGFLFVYHFIPLQLLAYVSLVNLNNMLCPAVSDPFHGIYYRLFAICHQLVLIQMLGKVLVIIARATKILPCASQADMQIVCCCEPGCSCCATSCLSTKHGLSAANTRDCFTEEDANHADDASMLSSKFRHSRGSVHSAPCSCCGDCGTSCISTCSQRSHSTRSKMLSMHCCKCCSSESFWPQHTLNGQLTEGVISDETCCRRWAGDASCCHQRKDVNGAGKNHTHSNINPEAHVFNCEHENDSNKGVVSSGLEKSQNGHAKSH